jgi:glycosylphosphatidylinositol transamidase (GPIT) subunit GPI8
VCPEKQCISHVAVRTDRFERDPSKTPITDFFGSVRNVELSDELIELTDTNTTYQATETSQNDAAVQSAAPAPSVKYFYASQILSDYIST